MAEFKSSARRIAFNPITLPDTASTYLRAEEKRIDKLREAYSRDIDNREQYADALEKKQETERRNVESNSQLKKQFDQTYTNALRQRYNQINQKEADKTRAYENRLKQMSEFSKKAGAELKAFGERRSEEQQNIGFNIYNETGVDPVQLQEFRIKMADLEAEGIAEEGYINSLEAKGVDVAALRRVQGLSGWRLVGAQKAMAKNAGADWKAFTENPENREKKYDIGDGTMLSLEEALNDPDPNQAHFNTVLSAMRAEFTKPYSDLSPEFSHEHFWPGVNGVTETLQSEFHSKDQAAFRAARAEGDINLLTTTFLESEGEIDLSNLLEHYGGGTLGYDRLHVAVNKLIEIGRFGDRELEALKNATIFKDGKAVSYLDAFSKGKGSTKHLAFLNTAAKNIHNQSENVRTMTEAQLDASAESAVEKFVATATTSGISPSQYQKWEATYIQTYNKQPPAWLKTYATNETYGVAEAEAILEEKWRDGTLTSDVLKMKAYQQLLPERRQYYQTLAGMYEEQASSDQIKAHEKDIKGLVSKALKMSTVDDINGEVNTVAFHITQDYKNLVQRNISSGAYSSAGEATSAAMEQIRKELALGAEKEGLPYSLNRLEDGSLDLKNPGFAMMKSLSSPHKDTATLIKGYDKQYALDNDVITKKQLFGSIDDSNSLISRIDSGYRNGGFIPEAIKDIAVKDKDRSVLDIVNSQLEKYNLPLIKASRDQAVQYATDPEFRRLITHMTSESRVFRGLTNTNYKNGVVGIPAYKPMLDLIASKESANDTEYGGYDSLNTGGADGGHTAFGSSTGTKKFQTPLTEMTVEEVMNLQNDGVLHATGRYQIIRSTLANVVSQVGLDPKTTKYDEATQDLLAIHLLWGRVGKQLRTDGQALIGLGQEWIGLQNVSSERKIAALELIKSDPRYKNFDSVRLYPNLLGK
jgi:hypothetical protein